MATKYLDSDGLAYLWQKIDSQDLSIKGVISSSDNCNNLEQGVYVFSTSTPQNAPAGVQYGVLIVIKGNIGSIYYNLQLLSTSGRGFYYRRKMGSVSDGFANWTKVTGTQVS